MLLNGGQLDGARLLGPKTVGLMTANHLPAEMLPIELGGDRMPGVGFGLGFRVVMDVAQTGVAGSEGEYGWGGLAGTYYWIDPVEELIGIMMIQLMPNDHLPIREQFSVLVNQAIVE